LIWKFTPPKASTFRQFESPRRADGELRQQDREPLPPARSAKGRRGGADDGEQAGIRRHLVRPLQTRRDHRLHKHEPGEQVARPLRQRCQGQSAHSGQPLCPSGARHKGGVGEQGAGLRGARRYRERI